MKDIKKVIEAAVKNQPEGCSYGSNTDPIYRHAYRNGATFITKEYAVIDKRLLDEVISNLNQTVVAYENQIRHYGWYDLEYKRHSRILAKLKAAKECDE